MLAAALSATLRPLTDEEGAAIAAVRGAGGQTAWLVDADEEWESEGVGTGAQAGARVCDCMWRCHSFSQGSSVLECSVALFALS